MGHQEQRPESKNLQNRYFSSGELTKSDFKQTKDCCRGMHDGFQNPS